MKAKKRKSPKDNALARWQRDPVSFISEVLVNPETGAPFELYPEEIRFLRKGFTPKRDGSLPCAELLFSAPKKSGKSTFAAMIALYVIVALGGSYGEAFCVANDMEQAKGRVFESIARIVRASPLLRDSAKITGNKIEFLSTGATITALASDYAGAAGSNPTITVFDELWGYISERSHRLWDEMVPVPTRKVSVRLTVTYAGFSGESDLLESLYKRGVNGEQIAPDLYQGDGMLAFWTHVAPAPWQSAQWRDQMRQQLRPNAFLRLIQNEWVTTESTFVPIEWWDACLREGVRPIVADPKLAVWVGLDGSVKRDTTALAVCAWDRAEKRVRLVQHRIFTPTPTDPINFEALEKTLLQLRGRFHVKEIRYDPYQLASTAQRLQRAGLPMVEFPQTVAALTESSSNLYDLLKGRNFSAYPDADLRLAISRCVAIETSRGWRIAKEKASHRIDVIVALAMAALGAVQEQGGHRTIVFAGSFGGAVLSDSFAPLDEDGKLAPLEEVDLDTHAAGNECAGCRAIIGLSAHRVKRGGRLLSLCGVCHAKLEGRAMMLRA